ncbi:hypothetical protein LINGRAHAP2_LOCUS4132 [Linum grandiflorum]
MLRMEDLVLMRHLKRDSTPSSKS